MRLNPETIRKLSNKPCYLHFQRPFEETGQLYRLYIAEFKFIKRPLSTKRIDSMLWIG